MHKNKKEFPFGGLIPYPALLTLMWNGSDSDSLLFSISFISQLLRSSPIRTELIFTAMQMTHDWIYRLILIFWPRFTPLSTSVHIFISHKLTLFYLSTYSTHYLWAFMLCICPPEYSGRWDGWDFDHRFGSYCRGHHDQQARRGFGGGGPGWTCRGGGSSGWAEWERPLRREGGWSGLPVRHQLEKRNKTYWLLTFWKSFICKRTPSVPFSLRNGNRLILTITL